MLAPMKHGRLIGKTTLIGTAGLALAALLAVIDLVVYLSFLPPALFNLNRECQEEGYYMAEFEFKMMVFAYQQD